jgi:hypothetical protein
MKKALKWLVLPVVFSVLLAVSCKKADYLTDEGVHNAVTPLSTYDYLKAHPWKLFDTLIMVIDRYNLKDQVNQSNTFFAATNYSINRFLNDRRTEKQLVSASADYTLDSLFKYVTADSIKQYMFNEKLQLAELPENETRVYQSIGEIQMGVYKELQQANSYTERTNAPTHLLYLVKIRGTLDVPGTTPPANENDIRVLCQTTGILTFNGERVLHVLNNNHTYIRF